MNIFFMVFPFWCAGIIGINIWTNASEGRPFDWWQLLIGAGMIAWGGLIFLVSRTMLNFFEKHYSARKRP